MIITLVLIGVTAILVFASLIKSRKKTAQSFKAAGKMSLMMVGEIIGILAIIGLVISLTPDKFITGFLGNTNKLISTVSGAVIGTVTIIPGIIAFPLAKELFDKGAQLTALAAFITTLTMVGFVTMPVEIRHFGKKFTFYRNAVSFIFAICIALLMGALL